MRGGREFHKRSKHQNIRQHTTDTAPTQKTHTRNTTPMQIKVFEGGGNCVPRRTGHTRAEGGGARPAKVRALWTRRARRQGGIGRRYCGIVRAGGTRDSDGGARWAIGARRTRRAHVRGGAGSGRCRPHRAVGAHGQTAERVGAGWARVGSRRGGASRAVIPRWTRHANRRAGDAILTDRAHRRAHGRG